MGFLAQVPVDVTNEAVKHGVIGLLALIVTVLAVVVSKLYAELRDLRASREALVTGHVQAIQTLHDNYREKVETLLREQIELVEANSQALKDTAAAIRQRRGTAENVRPDG